MRPDTDCGRLCHALVKTYPSWIGGEADGKRYGFKYHTQSQRSGELHRHHGLECEPRRREGQRYSEYRFIDDATFQRARSIVHLWWLEKRAT